MHLQGETANVKLEARRVSREFLADPSTDRLGPKAARLGRIPQTFHGRRAHSAVAHVPPLDVSLTNPTLHLLGRSIDRIIDSHSNALPCATDGLAKRERSRSEQILAKRELCSQAPRLARYSRHRYGRGTTLLLLFGQSILQIIGCVPPVFRRTALFCDCTRSVT